MYEPGSWYIHMFILYSNKDGFQLAISSAAAEIFAI